jgi:hypothetical protein
MMKEKVKMYWVTADLQRLLEARAREGFVVKLVNAFPVLTLMVLPLSAALPLACVMI